MARKVTGRYEGLDGACSEPRPGPSTSLRSLPFALVPLIFILAVVALSVLAADDVKADGTGDYPPPPAGDWSIDTYTSVWNESVLMHGNIIIMPGGTLNTTGVNVTFDCLFKGQYSLIGQNGSSLFMTASSIDAFDPEKQYGISLEHGSVAVVSETAINLAGWEGGAPGIRISSDTVFILDSVISHSNGTAAIYIDAASPRITGNAIIDNIIGIECVNGAMPVISENDVQGNFKGIVITGSTPELRSNKVSETTDTGIAISYTNITMMNNTVTAAGKSGVAVSFATVRCMNGTVKDQRASFHLFEEANVTAINTSIALVELKIEDFLSVFHYYVYGTVEVVWWSNLTGVNDTQLEMRDRYGAPSGTATTGPDGVADMLLLHLYDAVRGTRTDMWPHTVNATKGERTATGTLTDAIYWHLRLVLDDIDPLLTVKEPVEQGYVNRTEFTVSGTAWDNETGLASVEVRLDNGTWMMANGTDIWGINLTAQDGRHSVSVRAKDLSRNVRYVVVNFTVDTVVPSVNITSPKNGLVVNRTWSEVRGTASDDLTNVTVRIEGRPIAYDPVNGTFFVNLTLVEGLNNVRVDVSDEAGNSAWATVNITRDTMVSPFDVFPANNTFLNTTNITMHGDIEPFAKMRINGTNTTAGNGTFAFIMFLKEGDNFIFVEAWDAYGNYRNATIHYVVDTTPPVLNITSPPTLEVHTRDPGVNIKGYTEDGAIVTLNGKELMLFNNHFSQRVEVVEGENTFVLLATDAAGNWNMKTLKVFVDRTPPFLNITSPAQDQKVRGMYVHITGFTEPNSTVTIDGIVAATGPDGSFDAYANMKCGANAYNLEAKDRAGNVKRGTIRVVRVDKETDNTDKLVALGVLAAAAIVYLGILLWLANKNGYLDPAKRFFGEMKESAKETKDVELVGSERPGEMRSAMADAPGGGAPAQQPPGPQPLMIGPPDAAPAAVPAAPQTQATKTERSRRAKEMAELNALMTEEAPAKEPVGDGGATAQPQPPAKGKPTRPEVGPFKITPQGTKVRIAKGRPGPGPARGGGGPRGRGGEGGGRKGDGRGAGRQAGPGGGARQVQRQRRQ